MKYDRNRDSTTQDVKDEAAKVGTEVSQAAEAVKELVSGSGSVAEVKKEVGEAVEAVENVVAAAVDAVADGAKRFFKTVYGFRLHDPSQGKAIEATEPTEAEHTEWVKTQIAAGLVIEVDADGNQVSAPVAPPSKHAGENIDTDRAAAAAAEAAK